MEPHYSPLSRHWQLDETITFLNHGSFGATPIKILEEQNEWRKKLEAEPVRFMVREYENHWEEARKMTADFLGSKPYNLVFQKNATQGVNAILHSLNFKEGDELLTTSHAYGACVNTLKWYAEKFNLKVVVAEIPFPIKNENEIISALEEKITSKTKLALIDHITSPTAVIFPIEKITQLLKSKNIDVLIDGAHTPGMIEINLEKLGVDYFVGNCHKWICSPKGSAVLWVNEEKHHLISSLQISHTYDKPVERKNLWAKSFLWPGTDDFTSYLCVPSSIKYMESLFAGGWNELRKHNRDLAVEGRNLIAKKMQVNLPCDDSFIGSIATIPLGKTTPPPAGFNYIHPLQEELFSTYKIEVPVFIFPKIILNFV